MALLEIRTYPDTVLKQKAEPVTSFEGKIQQLFDDLDDVVTSGGQASTVFENSRLVQPYVCQAVRTGEESGSLGPALSYCADMLDESNTELLDVTTRLIEPAILIVMGVIVGGVAASLFIPLFDMTSAMH